MVEETIFNSVYEKTLFDHFPYCEFYKYLNVGTQTHGLHVCINMHSCTSLFTEKCCARTHITFVCVLLVVLQGQGSNRYVCWGPESQDETKLLILLWNCSPMFWSHTLLPYSLQGWDHIDSAPKEEFLRDCLRKISMQKAAGPAAKDSGWLQWGALKPLQTERHLCSLY